jgi:hypothetical protein
VIDVSDDIVQMPSEAPAGQIQEFSDAESLGVHTLSAEADQSLDAPSTPIAHVAPRIDVQDLAIDEFREYLDTVERKPVDETAWLTLGLRFTRRWPVMEGPVIKTVEEPVIKNVVPREPPADVVVAAPLVPPAAPPPAQPARPDHLDWSELVASLRQDIERRRKHPASTPAAVPAPQRTAESPAPPPVQPQPRKRLQPVDPATAERPRKGSPIQDEWGFFDPQQCGFAALLAKLDEFNEAADEPEVSKTS